MKAIGLQIVQDFGRVFLRQLTVFGESELKHKLQRHQLLAHCFRQYRKIILDLEIHVSICLAQAFVDVSEHYLKMIENLSHCEGLGLTFKVKYYLILDKWLNFMKL